MHIVFVTTELATAQNSSGGLASFTANMARIFTKKGNKVSIILSSTKASAIQFDEGIDLYNTYVPKRIWNILDIVAEGVAFISDKEKVEVRRAIINKYKSLIINNKIKQIHKKEKVDIIHFCNLTSPAYYANREIPYIIRISGILNFTKGAHLPAGEYGYKLFPLTLTERIDEETFKKSRYVVSPSECFAEVVRDNMNKNVTVIESPYVLGKNDWDYSEYERLAKGKKYILHYGRLSYYKGTHIVAEVAEELLRDHPDLFIILAGDNSEMMDGEKPSDYVIRNAKEYADRIIYLGKPVREVLYPFVENAMVCVLPSRLENLANTCIEAMAMGKIVVATEGVSFEQLIANEISGFLCERDNRESFLRGISRALALSEEEKAQMSVKAKKSVQKLSPENVYKNYLNYYEEVIRNW